MAPLVVYRDSDNTLSIKTFRFIEDTEIWVDALTQEKVELQIDNISRGAIQQIERHFIRLLNEEYLAILKHEESEVKKILRLYEIGARR